MITHIAVFKWKKDVSREQIDRAMRDIKSLRKKCEGVIDIICGENFSKYAKGTRMQWLCWQMTRRRWMVTGNILTMSAWPVLLTRWRRMG